MKKLQVKREFEYNKIGSWSEGNPYTIAFCYPKKSPPFIVKGGLVNVRIYVEREALTESMIVHYTLFWHKKTRTTFSIYLAKNFISAYLFERINEKNKKQRYELKISNSCGLFTLKWFKRPPRRWIKELNPFVTI